jgi:hypothetical protein
MKSVKELSAKIAELKAAHDAKLGVPKFMQLNGFLTFPKGLHKDLVGQLATGTITIQVNTVVTESGKGNATVHLTAKLPETVLSFNALSEAEELELQMKELKRELRKAQGAETVSSSKGSSLEDELA